MNFVEYQKSVVYQKSKDKKCEKLCQKLSNMSINNGLDLKTTLVWEKKKAYNNKSNIIYFGTMFFEVRVVFSCEW